MRNNFCKVLILTAIICLSSNLHILAKGLKFNSDGKFKIVQFTDTHIKFNEEPSKTTISMINAVLDAEKPDLVIFTGDVVTGIPMKEGFEFVLEPVISRQIPYAIVYGNHDDEQQISREELSKMLKNFPYNISKGEKLKNVKGYGNYVLEIKDSKDKKVSTVLYCMDSNTYSTSKEKGVGGYGWFDFNQVEWYRSQSDKYTKKNNAQPLPALAFFHIPLPEYWHVYTDTAYKYIGSRLEKVCAPEINTGMFTSMLEKGDVMGTFVGHDHINDYIFNLYGVALAYGRFSGSKTTYGDLPNGGRVIELTEGERKFTTWIREADGTVLHRVECPDRLPKKVVKKKHIPS